LVLRRRRQVHARQPHGVVARLHRRLGPQQEADVEAARIGRLRLLGPAAEHQDEAGLVPEDRQAVLAQGLDMDEAQMGFEKSAGLCDVADRQVDVVEAHGRRPSRREGPTGYGS